MHEMSLCEGILQILEEEARRQMFSRVRTVRLEVGELAGVELDAMYFGFDVVCRDTLADGARLEIVQRPGQAFCLGCGERVAVRRRFDACPDCGSYQLQVIGGDELRIKDLEVD
ncbi:hydrogenase maturation nickel metallochaperone HypA [Alkalilimnicola ehrlichii MLHE-1]|uniref:Hydrogenase maturation factor HypA n=1 Tax=Alkalilimnicola ehrlichii (strain ATCC BAA-1101 / DSM 17681 / MLHE-1) TaxID=187272 RepID=HYPA_ALKEH|nr:hydrogenase maturation nickel metallochaperone HypA [Alkalilimnicola ehrlichii]Q0A726.1 RecName: Full=Hydrogenase maturation factor HypA [Alkalilimnicola ehrlichii MLHE-1]ABI57361.1 hydrogenase nickel insertion protein HypA [Alkalilimnicola ehrlichii MLHE-1]